MSIIIRDLYDPGESILQDAYLRTKKYIVWSKKNHFTKWYSEYILTGLSICNTPEYKQITNWFLHNILFPTIYLVISEKERRVLLRICTGQIFSMKEWDLLEKQEFFYNILEFYKQVSIVVDEVYSDYLRNNEDFPF